MTFLVDAQLPPALCTWLTARGHRALHVAEIGMTGATDRDIAAYAEHEGVTIISKDEDFLILRLPGRFGFIWLRVGNASNRALQDWLVPRWPTVEIMLARGERLIEVR